MPDTATPQSATWALRRMLGLSVPCPTCNHHMALKTDKDFARGYCDFCKLTKHGPSGYDYHAAQRAAAPFRSEAETYSEGVVDDD